MKINIEKTKAKVAKRVNVWKNKSPATQDTHYKNVLGRLRKVENEFTKTQIRYDRLHQIYTELSWEYWDMREHKEQK